VLWWLIANLILSGVLTGGLYALFGLGLNLISNVLETPQLTLGYFFIFGAFLQYTFFNMGINLFVSTLLILLIAFFIGLLIDKFLRCARSHLDILMLTMALTFIMHDTIEMGMTRFPRALPYMDKVVTVGEISTTMLRIFIFIVSFLGIFGLWYIINKTHLGKELRAYAQDVEASSILGINVGRVSSIAQGLSIMLSSFAGAICILCVPVSIDEAWIWFFRAFTVMVMGGVGSCTGMLVAGTFIGVVETLSRLWFSTYNRAIGFYALLLFLLIRPRGIFGKKVLR